MPDSAGATDANPRLATDPARAQRDPSTAKTTDHLALIRGVKLNLRECTLRVQGTSASVDCKSLKQLTLSDKSRFHSVCL